MGEIIPFPGKKREEPEPVKFEDIGWWEELKEKECVRCLHEDMDRRNPDMKGKPRMLSCPCPRCSPYSMMV